MKRSELTARIRAARAEFEDLLAGLGPDEMTHPGVAGDWSVKDILAHIAWYEAEEARFYGETDVEGSPLWRVPQDPRNQMLFEEARERSLEQVLAEFRSGHERFLKVIEALSEEDLATRAGSPALRPSGRPGGESRRTRAITTGSTLT